MEPNSLTDEIEAHHHVCTKAQFPLGCSQPMTACSVNTKVDDVLADAGLFDSLLCFGKGLPSFPWMAE